MPEPLPHGSPDPKPGRRGTWPVRIAWFVGLWLAGIAAIGAVALVIRLWLVG